MKLTKLEQEILDHRLDVPDALFEALYDGVDDAPPVECVELLCVMFKQGRFEHAFRVMNTTIARDVLVDAVEGCTYVWAAESAVGYEITHQKFAAIKRAYASLEDKVTEFVKGKVKG